MIHAKVVSAKEEVATSEEVPSIHAVKPSPVAVLRGRQGISQVNGVISDVIAGSTQQ